MAKNLAPKFTTKIIDTLSKRAANWCSNPECRVLTAGPSEIPEKSVNIGEAAHIYGAKAGAARYQVDMSDTARSEITNAIWLCRNCHKLVDNDPVRFPAELLFNWRNVHENYVIQQIGTHNDHLRAQISEKEIADFSMESPLARQIIHDRPDFWEYSLTSELLRDYLKNSLRTWNDLQRGLYVKDFSVVGEHEFGSWLRLKLRELSDLLAVLGPLYTRELTIAWGEVSVPGNPIEIRHICKLIQDAAERLVRYEEDVKFVHAPEEFDGVIDMMAG